MKYLRRYLSLLFALAMFVGVFSITAHADSVEVVPYHIYVTASYNNQGGTIGSMGGFTFYPNNGTQETKLFSQYEYAYSDMIFQTEYTLANDNNNLFVKEGRAVKITIENITDTISIGSSLGSFITNGEVTDLSLYAVYTDGSRDMLESSFDVKGTGINVNASFTPSKDVQKFHISVTRSVAYNNFKQYLTLVSGTYKGCTIEYYFGEFDSDSDYNLTIEQSSEEAGLLNGILGKLNDLWTSITELPQKLWNLISEGLKNLFVPSAEDMAVYKDKWDELLSSRLGAVYQVVNILTESWDGVMNADQTDTIEFPQATLNFGNTSFTFGGYSVKIVPDGFSVLVTAIKSIVAILCTIAFVNGLRKRYDEIMGVQS